MSSDLIERLERAEQGSRELDASIAVEIRSTDTDGDRSLPEWASKNFPTWRARTDGAVETVHEDGTGGLSWKPRQYTTSIDAALTLVKPDRYCWAISQDSVGWGWAQLWPVDDQQPRPDLHYSDGVKARSPALALTIAALKARETSHDA